MHTLLMPENGRIVIPAALRTSMDVQAGQRVYLEARDGGVFMSTAAQRSAQRSAYFSKWLTAPVARVASEELMAERRQEVARDNEDLSKRAVSRKKSA